MLSSNYRFHGLGSLRYLFRSGQIVRSRTLLVRYCVNNKRQDSRVTVIIGKKVAKSAVVRNRIRRRIFEVVRTEWQAITPGHDISITVFSSELATIPHEELRQQVIGVLKQAHLYSIQGR